MKFFLQLFLWVFSSAVFIFYIGSSCARISSPQGGDKDTIPPILVRTKPQWGSTDFSGKKIVLTFNEYMQLKDINKQFYISPPMRPKPTIVLNGKNVDIKFNDTLRKSTTYMLHFGDGLADNNEGNVYKSYRYAFSTDSLLDTLRMEGKAIDAFTGEPMKNLIVLFYRSDDDSIIFKSLPDNVFFVEEDGFFTAEYLRDVHYKIVVIEDKDNDWKYTTGTELIGFLEETLSPLELEPPKHWFCYPETCKDSTHNHYIVDTLCDVHTSAMTADTFHNNQLASQPPIDTFPQLLPDSVHIKSDTSKVEKDSSSDNHQDHRHGVKILRPYGYVLDSTEMSKKRPQFLIRVFREKSEKQLLLNSERTERNKFSLIFSAATPQIDSFSIDSIPLSSITIEKSLQSDTLHYWVMDTTLRVPDTLYVRFSYLRTDSLGLLSPKSENLRLTYSDKPKKEEVKEEKPKKKSAGGLTGLIDKLVEKEEEKIDTVILKPVHWTLKPMLNTSNINPFTVITTSFSAPLITLREEGIRCQKIKINPRTKDTTFTTVPFRFIQDSLKIRHYTVDFPLEPNTTYQYEILPETFVDCYKQANDTIKGEFTTVNPEKTATMILHVENIDQQQYIFQLFEGKNQVREQVVTRNDSIIFSYLKPAEHTLKVIKDLNKNGQWDTGNYWYCLQPEEVATLQTNDKNEKIILKENWEFNLKVNIADIFQQIAVPEEEKKQYVD